MTNPMVKSAAVSDAGLTKQTLYEIGRENLTRAPTTARWKRSTPSTPKSNRWSSTLGGGRYDRVQMPRGLLSGFVHRPPAGLRRRGLR